jgi:hypothetical protein
MLNKESFEDYLLQTYRNNEQILEKAHYSRTDLTHTDSILLEVEVGGAKGGNNWNTQATNYHLDNDTRALSLGEQLHSPLLQKLLSNCQLNETLDYLCKSYGYSYYTNTVTSYGIEFDYYGNGKQYDVIAIPLLDFFSELLEDDDFDIVRKSYASLSKEEHIRIKEKYLVRELRVINEKLKSFDQDKEKEHAELRHDFRNYQQTVLLLEKRLENFESIKKNEEDFLKKRKAELELLGTKALATTNSNSVTTNSNTNMNTNCYET